MSELLQDSARVSSGLAMPRRSSPPALAWVVALPNSYLCTPCLWLALCPGREAPQGCFWQHLALFRASKSTPLTLSFPLLLGACCVFVGAEERKNQPIAQIFRVKAGVLGSQRHEVLPAPLIQHLLDKRFYRWLGCGSGSNPWFGGCEAVSPSWKRTG